MRQNICSLFVSLFIVQTASADVLITTGSTSDGKAFITVPTVTFTVNRNVSASGFNTLIFDFVDVWGTTWTSPNIYGPGSGLTFTDSAHPGTFSLANWLGHSSVVGSSSNFDSTLNATANTSYSYNVGEVITLQGGTYTLTTADASFPVFSSGSYDVYFAGLGSNGGFLTSPGIATIPEPATVALLAFVSAGTLLLRRRKRA